MKITPEVLNKITERYIEKIQKHLSLHEHTGHSRYEHVAKNLVSIMSGVNACVSFNPSYWEKKEGKPYYSQALIALKKYFSILERFHEFRNAEFANEYGFFSDIPLSVFPEELQKLGTDSISIYYVQEACKRLINNST